MGQTMCKRYCGCCPCSCCHPQSRTTTDGVHRETLAPTPAAQKNPKDHVRQYRVHTLPPDIKNLNDQLTGRVNPGFQEQEQRTMDTIPLEERPVSANLTQNQEQGKTNHQADSSRREKRISNFLRTTKVSTYSYQPRSAEDLQVKKGDELKVIEDQGEWIWAEMVTNDGETKTGYIPKPILAEAGSLEAEDWYFGPLSKMDAKRYLMQEQNQTGSFLLWKKENEDCYYLSVRTADKVRHYPIHGSDGLFYLVRRASYPSLKELVQHYQESADGLCTQLNNPCVKLDLPLMTSISHTTVDQLEIDPSSIQKDKKLGKGKFGMVWLGLWNGTTKVAIKELQVTAESLHKSLFVEAETMWRLSHEKLLRLYAVCLKSEPVFIVTEYMPNGTLKKYLRSHQNSRDLEFTQMVDFAVQIAQGMTYMEEKACVHRDLRTENILLSAMMSCKIGDFGLARFMESNSVVISADTQIPIKWTAPEVFLSQKYSTKSDVWSFGVLLGEIMTYGALPFPDKTPGQYREDILNRKALQPPESPAEICNIMEMCWRYQSGTRPSFCEIERHLVDLLNPLLADDTVE
ncbi:tyrosine-protein kinase FRK-like [Gastrophryne carolinensis]